RPGAPRARPPARAELAQQRARGVRVAAGTELLEAREREPGLSRGGVRRAFCHRPPELEAGTAGLERQAQLRERLERALQVRDRVLVPLRRGDAALREVG